MFGDLNESFSQPLMFIYQYLCQTVLSFPSLTTPHASKLSLKNFIETYMGKHFEGNISITIEKETYVIPKTTAHRSFKEVFEEGILPLPSYDNLKFMGFKNNQEMLANYSIAKDSFKLLSSYFHETKLEDLDDKLLDKTNVAELQATIKKTTEDLQQACYASFLEYSLLLIDRYEDNLNFSKDASEIVNGVTSVLSQKYFDKMVAFLNNLSSIPSGGKTPASKIPKGLKLGAGEDGSIRSGEFKKDDSTSLKSIEKPAINFIKTRFRKSFLLHEFKTLRKLSEWVCRDLNLLRLYLSGEPVYRTKEYAGEILHHFFVNQVPPSWIQKLGLLNLGRSSFSSLVKSLLIKFDQVYSLIVKLRSELPPVIPVNRLLDPHSFFLNLLHVNCRLRNMHIGNCVFTLRTANDRQYPESSTTLLMTGLKIVGGALDLMAGELIEENAREFAYDIGRMYLDVVDADPTENSIGVRFGSSSGRNRSRLIHSAQSEKKQPVHDEKRVLPSHPARTGVSSILDINTRFRGQQAISREHSKGSHEQTEETADTGGSKRCHQVSCESARLLFSELRHQQAHQSQILLLRLVESSADSLEQQSYLRVPLR